jgi:CRISPR-associated protein Csb1
MKNPNNTDSEKLKSEYDSWLKDGGPAALVLRQELEPVEGRDGIFFPATYAPAEDRSVFAGGYNINTFSDGTNVCLVDSVGSQANRLEPLFKKDDYKQLVPQIVITAGAKRINLLEAGHRAGDAIARSSTLKAALNSAFRDTLNGNSEPLAKIAPTSLVFGVWDSRDTEAKLPRLITSTIRAFNVKRLTRSASYLVQQQIDYTKENLIPLWESEKEKELYSKRGFLNALASASPGGVMLAADGKIIRDTVISLAALRRLAVTNDDSGERTMCLRRYVLGLCLVVITAPVDSYLRQGCNLVGAFAEEGLEFKLVFASDRRLPEKLAHVKAKAYAEATALAFVVGDDRTVPFLPVEAEGDIKGTQKIEAEVCAVNAAAKSFSVKTAPDAPEMEIPTDEKTKFKKGRNKGGFDDLVVGKKVAIEIKSSATVSVVIQN